MHDELEDIDPVALQRSGAALTGGAAPPARAHSRAARLVARLYAHLGPAQRSRMLQGLLRPLGTLGLAAVASGAFAGLLWDNPFAHSIDLAGFTTAQVLDLAHFVEQAQPEALRAVANSLAAAPAELPSFAAASLLLLRRLLDRRLDPGGRS